MRRRSRHGRGDEGVSAVVGTILLAGMLLTTLVSVRLYYVPVWEENSEASQVRALQQDVGRLASTLDEQANNVSSTPVLTPLTFQREDSGSILAAAPAAPLARSVAFNASSGLSVNLSAPLMLLRNESATGGAVGLDENWVNITGTTNVTNILDVQSFRLRIDEIGKGHDGQSITMNINDSNGNFAGNLTAYQIPDQPDSDLMVEVCNRHGCNGNNVLFNQGAVIHISNVAVNYIIDLLDPEYRFNLLLTNASTPYQVSMTQNGFTGAYAITYSSLGGAGGGGGGGTTPGQTLVQNYTSSLAGGTLTVQATNLHLPSQTYVIENGALIVQQPDGAAMRLPPPMAVRVVNGATLVSLGLPMMTGPSGTLAAGGTGAVTTTALTATSIVGQAPSFTLSLTTQFPSLWAAYWNHTLGNAGLGPGNYAVSVAPGSATLVVYGLVSDPLSQVFDIQVMIHVASIDVRF